MTTHGQPYTTMAKHGRPRPTMVRHGWPCRWRATVADARLDFRLGKTKKGTSQRLWASGSHTTYAHRIFPYLQYVKAPITFFVTHALRKLYRNSRFSVELHLFPRIGEYPAPRQWIHKSKKSAVAPPPLPPSSESTLTNKAIFVRSRFFPSNTVYKRVGCRIAWCRLAAI